ncbi:MAG TPA: multiheme c-type cytochrome [Bryobacteraceae bacterium]|nr:multiheme c-type cytochrome [Bryobacteraceae bacterium]
MRNWLCLLSLSLSAAVPSRVVRECANCHPAQARPHPQTSMAHAMELPAECAILKQNPLLTFQQGHYSYKIVRQGDTSIYTVTDGVQTITVPLGWAFGLGRAGQTYVFEKDGTLYESRVSYYSSLGGLDLTMGAANLKPANLLEAAGRSIVHAEGLRCFGCHSTNAVQNSQLNLTNLTPGVQCERCHGSAENHLQGIRQGNTQLARMKDLRSMSSEDTSNFCGQCHRTWAEIASSGVLGIANIRFQPYRLTNSKCYDADDARIRCTACHDPHTELNSSDSSYDAKCQACHGGGKPSARICKVANGNCVSCHMPKLEMPGAHHKFTDHNIRIVKANEPYPN